MIKQKSFEIDTNRCWCCGLEFSKEKNSHLNKTGHHAIPHALKPKMNVIIPICVECHDKIHGTGNIINADKQAIEKAKKILKASEELKSFLEQISKSKK